MKGIKKRLPLAFYSSGRARKVSMLQRLFGFLFGAPNARRGNGIIYSGLDIFGFFRSIFEKAIGRKDPLPVYEIDRIGTIYSERLPRIWLSEKMANTSHDGDKRVFVECYPAGPDYLGERALELGDRYLGEGCRCLKKKDGIYSYCFQAAEILYLHSVRRGNREAARRLKNMYESDLCEGQWFQSYLEQKAKHALKCSPLSRDRIRARA